MDGNSISTFALKVLGNTYIVMHLVKQLGIAEPPAHNIESFPTWVPKSGAITIPSGHHYHSQSSLNMVFGPPFPNI